MRDVMSGPKTLFAGLVLPLLLGAIFAMSVFFISLWTLQVPRDLVDVSIELTADGYVYKYELDGAAGSTLVRDLDSLEVLRDRLRGVR